MRLHEEYILRKGLDLPVILYEKRSNVFLRSKEEPYQWMVFNISWVDGRHAPGMFCVTISKPLHNGYREKTFFYYTAEKIIQWDEYSDFIVDYAKSVTDDWFVVPDKERNLALWQMFLQVYDGWIVKNTNRDFYRLVEESIRLDNDFHRRSTVFRNARTRLETCDEISQLFKYEIFPLAKGHSIWLEKLINV
jgi:hypothetical protein